MITAIRLREYNKKIGHLLRTYTMASGAMFTAGEHGLPSAVQIVTSPRDIAEAREIPQFEVITCADEAELRGHLTGEMESRARIGLPAVRAMVQEAKAEVVTAEKARRVQSVVAPVNPFADEEDEDPEAELPSAPVPVAPAAYTPGRATADILTPDPLPAPEPAAGPPAGGRKPSKASKRVPR